MKRTETYSQDTKKKDHFPQLCCSLSVTFGLLNQNYIRKTLTAEIIIIRGKVIADESVLETDKTSTDPAVILCETVTTP